MACGGALPGHLAGAHAGRDHPRHGGEGGAERLTPAADDESHIPESWSPDGRRLAFSVRAAAAQGASYMLHMRSAGDGKVVPFGGIISREPIGAVFSPDGRWVASPPA